MNDFMPHGMCLQWNPALLSIFVIGNSLVALAYFSIPLALGSLVRKRKDLSFGWIYGLFGVFMVACGLTHVFKIWTIWFPIYWQEAAVDLLTGLISVVTAVFLWRLPPKALSLPVGGEKLFQENFDLMPQLGWTTDAAGEVDFFNKGWYDYTGKTFEQLKGWGWQSVHKPEIFPRVKERWLECVSSLEPFEMEFPLLGRDGYFRYFLTRINPSHSEQGNVLRWVGVSTDIHDQKELEELLELKVRERTAALEELQARILVNEGKFRAIFDQTFQFTGLLSESGIVLQVNQTALNFAGVSEEDVTNKPIWLSPLWVQSDEQQAQLKNAIKDAASGKFVRFETVHFGLSGRRDIDFSLKPFMAEDGKVLLIAEGRDITERKEAEKQLSVLAAGLARSNEDLRHFAYAASHDLQEPLRTVTSFCSLLNSKIGSDLDPDSQKYLAIILDATSRMQQLIKALLQYATIGAQDISERKIDLAKPVSMALDALQAAIDESSAVIRCDQLPNVLGDVTQLSLLFQNLISNSIKFRGKEPPEIHISAVRSGDNWEIAVRDNGCGFKMEYAERIFLIFQKLHSRSKYEGTGIGLAACKRIVERHNGVIRAESNPEEGATFFVTLKAAENN